MPEKTAAEKARIKPGTTIGVLHAVPGIIESLGLPADVAFTDATAAKIVFLFVNSRSELDARMPEAVASLAPGSALWVFFRKGAKAAGLDMGRNDVWELAEKLGMRPLGLLGVDATWSAFRLRPAG